MKMMLTRDTAAFIDSLDDADTVLVAKCMIRSPRIRSTCSWRSFVKHCGWDGDAYILPQVTDVIRSWLKTYTLPKLAIHIDNCDECEDCDWHRLLHDIECVAYKFKDNADTFLRSLAGKYILTLASWLNTYDGFDGEVAEGVIEDIREELRDCSMESLKNVIDFGINRQPENENLLALRGKFKDVSC